MSQRFYSSTIFSWRFFSPFVPSEVTRDKTVLQRGFQENIWDISFILYSGKCRLMCPKDLRVWSSQICQLERSIILWRRNENITFESTLTDSGAQQFFSQDLYYFLSFIPYLLFCSTPMSFSVSFPLSLCPHPPASF